MLPGNILLIFLDTAGTEEVLRIKTGGNYDNETDIVRKTKRQRPLSFRITYASMMQAFKALGVQVALDMKVVESVSL